MGDTERDRRMEDRDMEQRGQESRAKKASAVFERKTSDGQSFWSLSARNSVQSMFSCSTDNNHQAELGNLRRIFLFLVANATQEGSYHQRITKYVIIPITKNTSTMEHFLVKI